MSNSFYEKARMMTETDRTYSSAYYAKHREHLLEKQKAYNERNKEKIREYQRSYRLAKIDYETDALGLWLLQSDKPEYAWMIQFPGEPDTTAYVNTDEEVEEYRKKMETQNKCLVYIEDWR